MSFKREIFNHRESPFQRAAHRFQDALAALAAGSAAVPFGDNGKLFQELADLRRRRQRNREARI
jgi:hypothetical protein